MTINDRAFGYAQLGYIAAVSLALLLLPGAHFSTTLIALIAVWIMISAVYQSSPWRNREGWWTLLISTTLLSVGIISNVHLYTTSHDATTELPMLLNPDSARYYYDALHSAGHPAGIASDIKNHGYGLLISCLWQVTGITIVAPLVLNMLLVLLSIIMCGGIAWRVLRGTTCRSGRWIASCAMIMSASVCYFLNSGTLLLKEASLTFALAITGFAMTTLVTPPATKKRMVKFMLMFVCGGAFLALLRYNYLIMLLIGIVMLAKWQRSTLRTGAIMATICVACWATAVIIARHYQYDLTRSTAGIISGNGLDGYFLTDVEGHATYNSIITGYFDFPWWEKTLLLPMTAAVQYLIPLPWGFCDDIGYGYTLAWAHVSLPWYAVGGLILFYLITAMRRSPDALRRLSAWGTLMWLVPAYLFAGTVSRYTLPLLPLLIPCATYIAATWHSHTMMKRWAWCYSTLLIIGLIAGYIVQKGLLP